MEGQESHHGVETAPEAGVGRVDYPKVLPSLASCPMAHVLGPQPAIRVSHLSGLATDTLNPQGDQFFIEKTLSQVEGKSHIKFCLELRILIPV